MCEPQPSALEGCMGRRQGWAVPILVAHSSDQACSAGRAAPAWNQCGKVWRMLAVCHVDGDALLPITARGAGALVVLGLGLWPPHASVHACALPLEETLPLK